MGFQLTPRQIKAADAALRERVADLDPGDVVGRVTALAEVMTGDEAARKSIRKAVAVVVFVMTNGNIERSTPTQERRMLAFALSLKLGVPHPRAIPLLDAAGVISPRSDGPGGYWVAYEIEERIVAEGDGILRPLGFLA
jgi:hypothetical protein